MIEAVNSVLQTAPIVRGSSEQVSTADSFAANPERVQKVAQAPFVSPYIHVDVNYNKAVLQLRDSDTGDVENQFPSRPQLEAQARAAARRQVERQAQSEPRSEGQNVQATAQKAEVAQQSSSPSPEASSISQRQQAAFETAARSGNSNAGNITLFA